VGDSVAEQPFNWRPTLQQRLTIAVVVIIAWSAVIEARLVYLQILSHDDLVARAERQQLRTQTVPAKRGEIYDRRGRLLAYSVDADTIYAVPVEIPNRVKTAAALCAALDGCDVKERQSIAERLSRQRAFVYVRRRVSPAEARRVADLNLEGIGFMKESRRFYPNKELARTTKLCGATKAPSWCKRTRDGARSAGSAAHRRLEARSS
jgi:cell division protein FtsI (penicillin-binding protein 3)